MEINIFRFLVKEANASIHITDDDGDTSLHYAAFGRQAEVMEFLLNPSLNANINAVNMKQCSVLHVSVVMQDIRTVALILKQHNIEVIISSNFPNKFLTLLNTASLILFIFLHILND